MLFSLYRDSSNCITVVMEMMVTMINIVLTWSEKMLTFTFASVVGSAGDVTQFHCEHTLPLRVRFTCRGHTAEKGGGELSGVHLLAAAPGMLLE